FQQVVDHVRPAERTGGGAVHQHHRNAVATVRLQREQVVLGVGVVRVVERIVEQAGQFPGPALSLCGEQCAHRGLVVFQRHRLGGGAGGGGGVGRVGG